MTAEDLAEARRFRSTGLYPVEAASPCSPLAPPFLRGPDCKGPFISYGIAMAAIDAVVSQRDIDQLCILAPPEGGRQRTELAED